MVQLKRNLQRSFTGTPDNTYWALGEETEVPDEIDIRYSNETFIEWINELQIEDTTRIARGPGNRIERGMLDYEQCTPAELESFIIARHLKLPRAPSFSRVIHNPGGSQWRQAMGIIMKDDYITVLQAGDDSAVFGKFLELPPEIRANIYEKYFGDLAPLPALRHQPPITLASSLVRKESLPVFYEHATFTLRMGYQFPTETPVKVSLCNTADDPDHMTSSRLLADNLSRISRFRLCLCQILPGNTVPLETVDEGTPSWLIDIGERPSLLPTLVQAFQGREAWVTPREWTTCLYWTGWREAVEGAIMPVLQRICARPGPHKFRRDDLEELRLAVYAALEELCDT